MKIFTLNSVYRWCDNYGGGLVIARSKEDAKEKLVKKFKNDEYRGGKDNEFTIWEWKNDDYFDKDNRDVLDIYG